MPRPKLGEILLKEGLITQEQLDRAMIIQRQEGGRLGEILIKLGNLKEDDIVVALGKQLGIPYCAQGSDLLRPAPDQNLEELISREFALQNIVLPLSRNLNSLTCAMFDPLDLMLLDNLRKMTGCEINPVIATKIDIIKAIEEHYARGGPLVKEAIKGQYKSAQMTHPVESTDRSAAPEESLSLDKLIAHAEEAPVVKLVDLIVRQAIDERASDIHIEPFKDRISLRFRIDGVLYEIPPPAKHLHLAIISRIKILAHLDIAEKRLPQDGAFMVKLEDRRIDLRISTIPTIHGEKVVIRILDKTRVPLDLSTLGFESAQLEDFRRAINAPYGLVLVTGPTGSGKSTTLYAALSEINDPKKNILTVEDPVEYHLDGVNQVQVKPEIGLTFATALRAFLRQDPDVMLVGEIRDLETSQICVRSALTGHLVLSTLHTNDAPSAITRLLDIGIESYLLMPSLLLVVAQRLVRRLCPDCKEAYEPSAEQIAGYKLSSDLIYRARGCDKCSQIGYKGRIAVHEVMVVNEDIKLLISERASFQKIRQVAMKNKMETLFVSGLRKVRQGVTSLEEVLSVAFEEKVEANPTE